MNQLKNASKSDTWGKNKPHLGQKRAICTCMEIPAHMIYSSYAIGWLFFCPTLRISHRLTYCEITSIN